MIKRIVLMLAIAASAGAQAVKNDYGDARTWLCRPGRQDACVVDLTTTIVAANGTLTREEFKANLNAPIDCFYVYPTVSFDKGGNSDMEPGPEENGVVRTQLARFASQCRLYAPMYRQATLTALRAATTGSPIPVDRALGYNDVLDAWNYYLQHDNNGRGVVLIGHSQGSGVLTQLIRNEIDGKPVQAKIVSALLLGTSLPVPKGKDVGGAFQHVPVCRSPSQTGCVIAYASFRSTIPPPENTRFGRVQGDAMQAACANPAALAGGSGELHAYLSASGRSIVGSAAEPRPWVTGKAIDTPWVSVPGLLTAQCVSNEKGSYLEVTVHGDPKDPRTDDIVGDVMANGQPNASWGLHLVDVNVAMGNLVDIVGAQARAFTAQRGTAPSNGGYPITVIPTGKGPFTFPDGYQIPWDKIEIRVTEKMSPNLFVLHGSQGLDPAHPDASGGRAMALFGPDGVLLVDTENRQVAEKTLKAIRSFTDAPIKVLVNTHIHPDHTGANAFFAQQGAVIFAQENLRTEMVRPPLRANGQPAPPPEPAAVPKAIYAYNPAAPGQPAVSFEMNGETVDFIPMMPSHTAGDTIVRFRKADVIYIEDFYRNFGYPFADQANGGSVRGMLDAIDLIDRLAGADTTLVPGHGTLVKKRDLQPYRAMLVDVMGKVKALREQGKSLKDVLAANLTAPYDKTTQGDTQQSKDRFITEVYDEVKDFPPVVDGKRTMPRRP